MALEVYTRTKPASARRTLFACLVLILATTLLATQMTRDRAAKLLGGRVKLPTMRCSIRPPRGSTPAKTVVMPHWRGKTFDDLDSPWSPAKFALWYTTLSKRHASERLATEIFEDLYAGTGAATAPPSFVRSRDVFIGPYPAVEVWNEVTGIVVRVGEAPDDGYFEVSMV